MKIILKILFLHYFIGASFNTNAQLSIGGRVGVNIANIKISEGSNVNPNSISGFYIAVPFEIRIVEKFSIQPELEFIQKGFQLNFDFGGITASSKLVINQLDVPILAKYSFVNTESIAVYVAAGPVFGYALNGKIIEKTNGQKTTDDVVLENSSYNRFEVGASLGAGIGFVVGPGQIVLDLRYVLGLSDLDNESDINQINNKGFQIGVGYMALIGGNGE